MKAILGGLLLWGAMSQAQQWNSDLEMAFQQARTTDKTVMIFFSVSEACDACRRLDRVVFQSEDFGKYASEELILVKMDFDKPANPEANAENLLIVEKYNKDGFFPWVVLVDKNRKVIGKAEIYVNQSPDEYLKSLKRIQRS